MRVIGFKIDKIIAERFKEPEGNIDLKSNFNIGKIQKEDINVPENEPTFSFEFTYTLDYLDHALIEFKGQIFLVIEKKISKDLEKEKKVISNEIKTTILNFVLFKTHVETLHLEEKLGLPFHIASPKASISPSEISEMKETSN